MKVGTYSVLLAAVFLGLGGAFAWDQVERASAEPARTTEAVRSTGERIQFGLCHRGGGYNCVVEGDTIWLNGQNIRVADIDAPETHEYRCPEEKSLGDRATQRVQELVNSGPVTLRSIDRDEDIHGRKLRVVEVSGKSVGATLVEEKLARWYRARREPWCD